MIHSWGQALSWLSHAVGSSAFLSRAEFTVCGGPAWLCLMLRTVRPAPMLMYVSHPLLRGLPGSLRAHALAQVQAFSQVAAPPFLSVAANWVIAAQVAAQVRLHLPVRRPHGLYVNQTYAPVALPSGRLRVVVTRIGQWARMGGIALLELTWSFLEQERKETGRPYPFEIEFLSIRVRKTNTNTAVSYADFAKYYACIFWPWDMMMLLFNELYTMAMPLLVPERRWMHQLMVHALRHTEVNWWHLRAGNLQGELPRVPEAAFPLQYLPWVANGEGLMQAAYWYELTDFVQFPQVTNFKSLPDMLEQLRGLDVPLVRQGMASFNRATLQASLAFYRGAAVELLR